MDTPSTRSQKTAKRVRYFNNTSIKRLKMDARSTLYGNHPQSQHSEEERRSSQEGQSQPVLTMGALSPTKTHSVTKRLIT